MSSPRSKQLFLWLGIMISLFSSLSYAQKSTTSSTLEKHYPQRIIALAPHIVEMLYDIGAGEKIVGTVEYADYPQSALAIPRIGGYHGLQIEKILALKPDLIIAWKSGNKIEDIEKFQRLGLPLIFSNPKNIADIAHELRYFGSITGYAKNAEIAAQTFEIRLHKIAQDQQYKKNLKTFYQLWSEPMMTVNKNTWINQLLTLCHADNVFAQNETNYPHVSIENVIVAKPELIVIPDEKASTPQPKIDWVKWPEIPAVKHKQLIHVNADLLHRYSTRMLDGVEDMCTKIDNFRKQKIR